MQPVLQPGPLTTMSTAFPWALRGAHLPEAELRAYRIADLVLVEGQKSRSPGLRHCRIRGSDSKRRSSLLFTANPSVSKGRPMSPNVDAKLFDPFDPDFVQNPYPVYEILRDRDPVHRTAFGSWILTRHEHSVRRASLDHNAIVTPCI